MYRKLYKRLFGSFALLGVALCCVGALLYVVLGPQAGRLTNADGTKSSLYVNMFLLILFEIIGGIFFLIGVIALGIRKRIEKRQKHLKENGRAIYAKILTVQRNMAVMVAGRHPYQVVAQYVDELNKTIYTFRSEYIKTNLGFPATQCDSVRVFVDPKNYKKYYMDLSSIIGMNGYKVENY